MDDLRSLVEEAVRDVHAERDALERTRRRIRSRERNRRIGAGTTALVLALAGTWLVWRSFAPVPRTTPAAPKGGRIVFSTQRPGDLMPMIAVMDVDGSDVRILAPGANPSWSPDGAQIAFTQRSDDGSSTGIFVMSADGTDVRRLTRNPSGEDEGPSWSPDGGSIAFTRSTFVTTTPDPVASKSSRDIYTVAPDGTGLAKLIGGPTDDFAPEWSPDGTRIAFVRIADPESAGGLDGTPQIWTLRLDGSESAQLTTLKHGIYNFDWSPDGSSFAVGVAGAIYVVYADGGVYSRLILERDVPYPFDPAWSPDGTRIVFTAGSGGDHDIYVASADGTKVIRLTGPAGTDNEASWWGSPRLAAADSPTRTDAPTS